MVDRFGPGDFEGTSQRAPSLYTVAGASSAMESQLGAMSGKVGAAQGQPVPFYFMRLAGQKLETPDPLARPVRVSAPVPGELRIDSSASDSVAHFLDKLDRLLSPIQLECAVALDEKSLEGKQLMVSDPGGVLDDGGEPHFAEYPHLVSVELFGSDVVVRYLLLESGEGPVDDGSSDRLPMMQSIHPMHFADAGRGGPYRPGPAFIQNRSVSIPVETRRSAETTLLYLSDPGNPHYELLGELQRSADRIAYLRKTYGHLPISSAIGICSDGLTKAYRNVELFGFSFSTRRLPFVVLAFIICSLVSILSTLVVSARVGQVPLSGSSDDYAVDILLSRVPAVRWFGLAPRCCRASPRCP